MAVSMCPGGCWQLNARRGCDYPAHGSDVPRASGAFARQIVRLNIYNKRDVASYNIKRVPRRQLRLSVGMIFAPTQFRSLRLASSVITRIIVYWRMHKLQPSPARTDTLRTENTRCRWCQFCSLSSSPSLCASGCGGWMWTCTGTLGVVEIQGGVVASEK